MIQKVLLVVERMMQKVMLAKLSGWGKVFEVFCWPSIDVRNVSMTISIADDIRLVVVLFRVVDMWL